MPGRQQKFDDSGIGSSDWHGGAENMFAWLVARAGWLPPVGGRKGPRSSPVQSAFRGSP
jgi:hypothetical protein